MKTKRYIITTNSPTQPALYALSHIGARLKAWWLGVRTFGRKTVWVRAIN